MLLPDITTPLPDGPLFFRCVEAIISPFGLGGAVSSRSVSLSTDMLALALVVQRTILAMTLCAHHGHVVVHGWDAGLAAMLWCSVLWMEVGNANVAFLTFIPCTVTSLFELLPCLFSANIPASRRNLSPTIRMYRRTSGGPHRRKSTVTTPMLRCLYFLFFHYHGLHSIYLSRPCIISSISFGTLGLPYFSRNGSLQISQQISLSLLD